MKHLKIWKIKLRKMRKKSEKVSVIIPLRNSEKTIGKTINSVLNQDYRNFEIIIIDDCSSDRSLEMVKKISEKQRKIKIIRNKKNLGPAASRNKGIKISKGKIIFFTDSDCLVPKNWIKSLLKGYKSRDIAGVGGYLKPNSNNFIAKLEILQNRFLLKISDKEIVGKAETPMGYTNNVSYRKSILEEVGGFDEKFPLPAGEDIDLKKRICERGWRVVYMPLSVTHLEEYDLNYLLKRLISRGLNITPPKSYFLKIIIGFLGLPIIFLNIIIKIIKYKKQGVI